MPYVPYQKCSSISELYGFDNIGSLSGIFSKVVYRIETLASTKETVGRYCSLANKRQLSILSITAITADDKVIL